MLEKWYTLYQDMVHHGNCDFQSHFRDSSFRRTLAED